MFSNAGIGDILLLKLLHNNGVVEIKDNIVIGLDMIKKYRDPVTYLEYMNFISKLGGFLWPENPSIFKFVEGNLESFSIQNDFDKMDWDHLKNFNLSSYFPKLDVIEGKYYVFNTKMRFVNGIEKETDSIKAKLREICSKIKLQYPIVLLGEKELGSNLEVKIHEMKTCYEELLLLKENNTVIDLTEDSTLTNSPNIDLFIRDVNILKNCVKAVNIGYGGNFCMSLVFAPACVNYVKFIGYPFSRFRNHNQAVFEYDSLENFFSLIDK